MYLRRKIDDYLTQWKNNENRYPLIIKGARQIGKTESVKHFADRNYESVVSINFALEKQFQMILSDGYDVENIIKNIRMEKDNFSIKFEDLVEEDFILNLKQSGIDMKIAVDISSLSYKNLVDKIVLISGDSDFVPASKIARREGIDFILNPMGNHIDTSLEEHIDGLINEKLILNILKRNNFS